MELTGILHLWSETGTEGGYWALQDGKFIFENGKRWSYDGLHILEDDDVLTIYSKEDAAKVVWTGTIKLKQYPVFTESAFGLWIHADQEGVDRNIWAHWFLEERTAKLIKAKPRE